MNKFESPSVTLLAKIAVVVALALAAVQVGLALVGVLLRRGPLRIETVADQLIGVIGDAALVTALLVVVFVGITTTTLKWTVAGLYVANLVGGVLFRLNYGNALTADLLVNPLFTITFFLAVVAAVRITRGETVFPDVDVTVDAATLRIERPGSSDHEESPTGRKPEPR